MVLDLNARITRATPRNPEKPRETLRNPENMVACEKMETQDDFH